MKSAELKKLLKSIIRQSPELNQKIVASRVGISPAYLNEVLNDNKGGSFDLISDIAEAANTSISELLPSSSSDHSEKIQKMYAENNDEKQLLNFFRALDTKKRFLLLSIAADYYEYCRMFKSRNAKEDNQ